MGYTLLLSLVEYKTLVIRGDFECANELLPSIPKEHHNSVARFLESRGMKEEALEVATNPNYKFDLSIQLETLDVTPEIASEIQSESKWKQLGELALSIGKLEMAEECLHHAADLSGLVLLYSSLGDAEGITKLASRAKETGKNNVAFLCLFMLGKLEDCLQLLIESNRIPEAELMARSYLPSKVSEIVEIWRKDLNKIIQKAAESLADPEEHSNLFDDWQLTLDIESNAAEQRQWKRMRKKTWKRTGKRRRSTKKKLLLRWMRTLQMGQFLLMATRVMMSMVRDMKGLHQPKKIMVWGCLNYQILSLCLRLVTSSN